MSGVFLGWVLFLLLIVLVLVLVLEVRVADRRVSR
jgi:hypothetical protein